MICNFKKNYKLALFLFQANKKIMIFLFIII